MGKWGKKKRKIIIIRLIKTSLKQQEWRTDESLNKQVNNNIRLLWDSYGLKTPHNMGCWFSVWRSKSKTCIYIYITKTKKKAHSHTHMCTRPPLPYQHISFKRISGLAALSETPRFHVGKNAFENFAKVCGTQRFQPVALTVRPATVRQLNNTLLVWNPVLVWNLVIHC